MRSSVDSTLYYSVPSTPVLPILSYANQRMNVTRKESARTKGLTLMILRMKKVFFGREKKKREKSRSSDESEDQDYHIFFVIL